MIDAMKGLGLIIGLIFLFALVLLGVAYIWMGGSVGLIELQREIFQSSRAYTESRVSELTALQQQYRELDAEDVGQKIAILNRMEVIINELPESEIPNAVWAFYNRERSNPQ